MRKIFQYSLLCFLVVTNHKSYAQTVLYSETEINGSTSYFYIIGEVKDHILIWTMDEVNPEISQLFIYDNSLHILKKIKMGITVKAKTFLFNFINNADSFQLIYQYLYKNTYTCKHFVFDENGKCLRTQLLDSTSVPQASEHDMPEIFSNFCYSVVISNSKKSFALIKLPLDKEKNILKINYRLFNSDTEIDNVQVLPYNPYSTQLCNLLLDKNNNLILLLTTNVIPNFELSVYKINPVDNSITNSLRPLPKGFVVDNTLNVSESNDQYIITGEWKKQQDKKENGIYLWRINKDLTDAQTDTIVGTNVSALTYIDSIYFFDVRAFTVKNNALHLFISSKENSDKYYYAGYAIGNTDYKFENEYSYSINNNYTNSHDALRNFVNKTEASGGAFNNAPYSNINQTKHNPQSLKLISLQQRKCHL